MEKIIYKFDRDMLQGEHIHINKKTNVTGFKKHWHNYYEIIYYRNCSGRCFLNGQPFELSDSCLFLLTPKDFHEITVEENPDSSSFIIAFSEQIADKKILSSLTSGPITMYGIPAEFDRKIEELYEIFKSNQPYRTVHLSHLFNCLLIDILNIGSQIDSPLCDLPPSIHKSISLMLLNPSYAFTLDYFAKKFKVTGSYFSRLFHESTGITFKCYLTNVRIEYAKRMLEEKDIPVISVGYECGFNTPSQFVRAFKNSVGVPPSEYRASKIKK